MTQPLFDSPAEPKLTSAQSEALEYVREQQPVLAFDVGMAVGAPEPWEGTRGNQILRALRKKGLVRYKRRLGWVLAEWRPMDDGPGPGEFPEGF